MVGPLMVLKMLHCRKHTSLKGHKKKDPDHKRRSSFEVNVSGVTVKVEENGEETCRVCLKQGRIPIYGSENSEDLSEALSSLGGIEVHRDDPHPKRLCQPCYALLHGAILLRKTAKQSDEILKSQLEKEPPEEIEEQSDSNPEPDDETDSIHSLKERKVQSPKILSCKRCDLQFVSFQEYSDHRLSAEHENKRIVCNICKNSYTPQYFKKHMALHKQETSYMCDVCGKDFIIQSQFTRHRLTHFYNLPFQCSQCPYRGRFSESLKMHMRSHTGEKPYQCTLCPSRFINKSNLNKHMLTHKSEHDFRCEVCGRGFYTKRDLEMHIKVDHTGIKEHICRMCGKAFGYRKQMMKHELRVHKREKLKSGRMPIYLRVETMNQSPNCET